MVKEKYFENQNEKATHNSFGDYLKYNRTYRENPVGSKLINFLLKY